MRSVLAFEVRTGRRITQVPVAAASWSLVHRGSGDIEVDIPLDVDEFRELERTWLGARHFGDPGEVVSPSTYPTAATPLWTPGQGMRPEVLAGLEPVRCGLAIVEDDTVLEAGPVWAWSYAHGGHLKVKASGGLWSLLDRRFVINGDAAEAWASWAVTYAGMSLGTIAKRLVQLTTQHAGGELPIVLPADVAGTSERTYRGHELATVRDRIDQIMGVIDGPDIAFEPRFTSDRLGIEWVMRIGTPLLHQAGDDHVWDARVPGSPVGPLSVQRDAGALADRWWTTGAGQDEALLMARREPRDIGMPNLRSAGYPLVEGSESRSSVERLATLNQWAAASVRAGSRPWQTWSTEVIARPTAHVDGREVPAGPQLGQYRPGDFARVWVPSDHPLLGLLLPQGFHRARILRVAGDLTDQVSLELAPSMEVR